MLYRLCTHGKLETRQIYQRNVYGVTSTIFSLTHIYAHSFVAFFTTQAIRKLQFPFLLNDSQSRLCSWYKAYAMPDSLRSPGTYPLRGPNPSPAAALRHHKTNMCDC